MRAVCRDLSFLPERVLLDGGFGTALMERGLDIARESTASWNLERPEEVLAVHREFAEAGAGVLLTNTFGANRLALSERESLDVLACNRVAVELAKEASGMRLPVAGCMGPSAQIPPPQGTANLVDLEESFSEQARSLVLAGADFLIVETMAHPKELRAALRGARDGAPKLAVVASIAARCSKGRFQTTQGFSIETMLQVAREEGAEGVGANCMLAPDDMLGLLEQLVDSVSVPVFAQPTIAPDGRDRLAPDEFANGVVALFEAGARAVGGCCGTRAQDIACARRSLEERGWL